MSKSPKRVKTQRRFARRPPRRGKACLPLKLYLNRGALPPPAPSDWTQKIASWPMDGNDVLGDCVKASDAHLVQIVSAYGTGQEIVPSETDVTNQYMQETGGADDGLVITDDLDFCIKNGEFGTTWKAYAAVNYLDQAEVMLALMLFGAVKVGVSLPANCFDAIDAGQPWTDTSGAPDPSMGHDMTVAAADEGGVTFVTWGQLQKATWAWFQKYVDECYVILTQDWEGPDDPSGLDSAALEADFALLSGNNPPIPPTPPVPPPQPPEPPGPVPGAIATLNVASTLYPGDFIVVPIPPQMKARMAKLRNVPWQEILALIERLLAQYLPPA